VAIEESSEFRVQGYEFKREGIRAVHEGYLKIVTNIRRLLKGIGLGLLTFLLVTAILPAVAPLPGKAAEPQQASESFQLSEGKSSADLLDRGRHFYEIGQFSEAEAVWRNLAREFEQQGDRAGQARSLSYLALAYQALGNWEAAWGAVNQSLTLLQDADEAGILAQTLNVRGQLQNARGQTEAALESWQQAEAAYRAGGDRAGIVGSQINQVQAMQAIGLYGRAKKMLAAMYIELETQPDSPLKATGLRSLGVVLQVVGRLQIPERGMTLDAQTVLEESLAIAQQFDRPDQTSEILFSLGNTARKAQQPEQALQYYQQAATTATRPHVRLEAQLNQLSLYLEREQSPEAISLIPAIEAELAALPASRKSVYAAVNFAQSLSQLSQTASPTYLETAARAAAQAVRQAKTLQDSRSEAFAIAKLGYVYAQAEQPEDALELTEQALQIAQSLDARDIAAQAAWQLGRLRRQQQDIPGAIAAYRTAFKILEVLRKDLVANPDAQFSFSETVEPVYRELVSLLLEPPTRPDGKQGKVNPDNLKEAQQVIESLQLAELDNFFRESCLEVQTAQIDEIDKTAAVIYPIILRDRLEVILSLPGQPPQNYSTAIGQAEIDRHLRQMRQALRITVPRQERLQLYQQAYDWLIRPAQAELERQNIKTLVFVLDGAFRRLPMAVLHDGQQYLVEKYNLAMSQGLQLLPSRQLEPAKLEAITAGLSESRQGFTALPGVESELMAISTQVASQVILNQEFTDLNLQNAIASTPAPIIHLATHGQFGSSAEDTFIITWDEKVNVKDLDSLLARRNRKDTNPIELLVLSACQTAKGDRQALLGLAGVAVRSGARSTLASLWSVRDNSTAELMSEFYQQLGNPGIGKAEALRRAQLKLLKGKYDHPIYWAPFVLVGNWQ